MEVHEAFVIGFRWEEVPVDVVLSAGLPVEHFVSESIVFTALHKERKQHTVVRVLNNVRGVMAIRQTKSNVEGTGLGFNWLACDSEFDVGHRIRYREQFAHKFSRFVQVNGVDNLCDDEYRNNHNSEHSVETTVDCWVMSAAMEHQLDRCAELIEFFKAFESLAGLLH